MFRLLWCSLLHSEHNSLGHPLHMSGSSPLYAGFIHDHDGLCVLIIFMTAGVVADVYGHVGWRVLCCRSGFQQQEMTVLWSLFRSFPFSAFMMQNASLIRRMFRLLACFITDVWSHIGWSCSAQACFAIADFSVSPFWLLTCGTWYSFSRLSWFHQCTCWDKTSISIIRTNTPDTYGFLNS